jgi:hypothetical protein
MGERVRGGAKGAKRRLEAVGCKVTRAERAGIRGAAGERK